MWQGKELKLLLDPQLFSHSGTVTICLLTWSQLAGDLNLRSHLVRSEANSVAVVYSPMLHISAEAHHQSASEHQLWNLDSTLTESG